MDQILPFCTSDTFCLWCRDPQGPSCAAHARDHSSSKRKAVCRSPSSCFYSAVRACWGRPDTAGVQRLWPLCCIRVLVDSILSKVFSIFNSIRFYKKIEQQYHLYALAKLFPEVNPNPAYVITIALNEIWSLILLIDDLRAHLQQVSALFSMRTVLLASSQSCRSFHPDNWCKQAIKIKYFVNDVHNDTLQTTLMTRSREISRDFVINNTS